MSCFAKVIVALSLLSPLMARGETLSRRETSRQGRARFDASHGEDLLPEFFRLAAHEFDFRQEFVPTASAKIELSRLSFPSPVETPHHNNNTVHGEYFRPLVPGRRPAVIVLHILGGDFELSRLFCRQLARDGTAALFVQLPYYGLRRQPDVDARMVSDDPQATVAGMKQAVLDVRRAVAWLACQEEVDATRLGIFGISLGGITSALVAAVEPRLTRVCLMLAGADVSQVVWESHETSRFRTRWLAAGGTKESLSELLKAVDPVTYARPNDHRKVLMLNAERDEVIPRQCTESLWRAFGEPEIVWFKAGHYSAIWHLGEGLTRVTRFFHEPVP